jgi:hypothetical protein
VAAFICGRRCVPSRRHGCSEVSQRTDVPSEESAELQRLYGEYTEVTARAAAALLAGDSQGFREEDGKVGLIVRRIKEIFGTTDQGADSTLRRGALD